MTTAVDFIGGLHHKDKIIINILVIVLIVT